MFSRILFLLLAALFAVQTYAASLPIATGAAALSNGERIKRGLPLKAPSRRYDPSRPHVFSPRASQLPLQVVLEVQVFEKRTYSQWLSWGSNGFFLTDTPSDATIFTLPGDGPVDSGYEASWSAYSKLGLVGSGASTDSTTWYSHLTIIGSDGGSPTGKEIQTSVWGISGLGSSVKARYFIDSSDFINVRFFVSNDNQVYVSGSGTFPFTTTEIYLKWSAPPSP